VADEALRVPKQAVEVELALAGISAASAVEVFVAEHQAHAYRRQDVLDLLEHEAAFLPARDRRAQTSALFNKDAVVWVAVPIAAARAAMADDEDEEELFDHHHHVRVELMGRDPLEGELLYSSPAEHARVADYLNEPGRFFRLWTTDRLYLVNRAYVIRVLEKV
jgi:hypothetical protein